MSVVTIPVDKIKVDSRQVRRIFSEESLAGLAKSISEVGLLHPILVKPLSDGSFKLIAGERRFRAVKLLGHPSIDAILLRREKGMDKQIQIIENIQRQDLDPLERAVAINEFLKENMLSKVEAAERLGIPRTTLTEWLNILDAEEKYQKAVVDNFYGGDSVLTLSHISIANGLASRLGSPGIGSILLDTVMEFGLNKAETRAVAEIVRKFPDVSIAEAVARVRPSQVILGRESKKPGKGKSSNDRTDSERVSGETDERFNDIILTVRVCKTSLKELRDISPKELNEFDDEQKRELMDELAEIQDLIEALAAQMMGVTLSKASKVLSRRKKKIRYAS